MQIRPLSFICAELFLAEPRPGRLKSGAQPVKLLESSRRCHPRDRSGATNWFGTRSINRGFAQPLMKRGVFDRRIAWGHGSLPILKFPKAK